MFCCCTDDEKPYNGILADPEYDWNDESYKNTLKGSDSDEDEDMDNTNPREQLLRMHSMLRQDLRNSIRPLAPAIHLEDFVMPVIPKSDQVAQIIDSALLENFVFSHLSEYERKDFVIAMQPENVKEGTEVITQGQTGDEDLFFYVIGSGRINIIIDGEQVGSLTEGNSFGELSLLYDSPRKATCIAATNCDLWKVNQHTFRHIMAKESEESDQKVIDALRKIPILDSLNDSDFVKFIECLCTINFSDGKDIIRKGDIGEVFYIIREGQVKVHNIGHGDSQFVDQVLSAGEWFGERSLLTGEPRAATVTAYGNCKVYALSRETFERVIGNLQDMSEKYTRKVFLKGMPIFANSNFTDFEMNELVNRIEKLCFTRGAKLCEVGKPFHQRLYCIVEGNLVISNDDGKLIKLVAGDYFGAEAIKMEEESVAKKTATVETRLTCLILSKQDIVEVIGSIDRLGKNLPYVPKSFKAGLKLKDIQKHKVLGMGAFGKVWLVNHKKDKNVPYALKSMVKRDIMKSLSQVRFIMRERNIMAGLDHPFVSTMVCTFQDDFHLYLLLPLLQGGELFSVINGTAKSGIPKESAAFYGACILDALDYLHQRYIAHRDLKPENILMDKDGYGVLVDFGFAKIVPDKTFTLCGTPEYMAPEIIMSKGHNFSVDCWALGVMLYEMIVGQSPFFQYGLGQMEMFKNIVQVKYSFPRGFDPDAKDLVSKLLVRPRGQRLGFQASGANGVKSHAFFGTINWKDLTKKEIRAPWIPDIKNPFDSSHFDNLSYAAREGNNPGPKLTTEEQELFKDF